MLHIIRQCEQIFCLSIKSFPQKFVKINYKTDLILLSKVIFDLDFTSGEEQCAKVSVS